MAVYPGLCAPCLPPPHPTLYVMASGMVFVHFFLTPAPEMVVSPLTLTTDGNPDTPVLPTAFAGMSVQVTNLSNDVSLGPVLARIARRSNPYNGNGG